MIRCTILLTAWMIPITVWAQALFVDGFDKKGEWGGSGYAHYGHSYYHIKAEEGRMVYYDGQKFMDIDVEVRTEFIDGKDDRGYGLMFRAQDYDNYHEFVISANGYIRVGGEYNNKWAVLSPWETCDAIRKGGVNFVRVSCRGEEFSFYVNGTKVKTLRDKRFPVGYIGLTAYGQAHVHFDDVKVFKFGELPKEAYEFVASMSDDSYDYEADPQAIHIENFSDKSGSWSESDFAHYETGFYKMYDTKDGRFSWQYGQDNDFMVETRARIFEWPKGGLIGLVAHVSDSKNYCGVFVNQEGKFYVEKSDEGVVHRLVMPTAVSFDPANVLTLGLRTGDGHLTAFLNGQNIADIEDPGSRWDNGNFGFYTSKNVGADFLSVKLTAIPFTWSSIVPSASSVFAWWPGAVVLLVVALWVRRSKRRKERLTVTQRIGQIVDMIKLNHGILQLGELMVRYKISKRDALKLMEKVAGDFGGVARATMDGGLEYDFPDFMPSEEKLQHDILQLASLRKGRITVTETAQHIKQDIVETETMLDLMVDNKRVRKVVEDGITYYEFVEIRKK